jgi:hypothetical protein
MRKLFFAYCTVLIIAAGCGCNSTPLVPSTVDTSLFDGEYTLDAEASFRTLHGEIEKAQDDNDKRRLEFILAMSIKQYDNFRIANGVIRSGAFPLTQEFSLISVTTKNGVLRGKAVWHEDVGDPGDESTVFITLKLDGDVLEFYVYDSEDQIGDPVILSKTTQTK